MCFSLAVDDVDSSPEDFPVKHRPYSPFDSDIEIGFDSLFPEVYGTIPSSLERHFQREWHIRDIRWDFLENVFNIVPFVVKIRANGDGFLYSEHFRGTRGSDGDYHEEMELDKYILCRFFKRGILCQKFRCTDDSSFFT